VDCISAAGSKSTAFGTLVSIIKNTELCTISVASDKFSDAAGNTNVDGVDANNSVFLIIDL
jgi:hypothetical protein